MQVQDNQLDNKIFFKKQEKNYIGNKVELLSRKHSNANPTE